MTSLLLKYSFCQIIKWTAMLYWNIIVPTPQACQQTQSYQLSPKVIVFQYFQWQSLAARLWYLIFTLEEYHNIVYIYCTILTSEKKVTERLVWGGLVVWPCHTWIKNRLGSLVAHEENHSSTKLMSIPF